MQKLVYPFLLCCLMIACSSKPPKPAVAAPSAPPAATFITNIKPLTLEGARSGEGYFSQDGKQLVFQSEREPKNPFYQIYLMDLTSRETTRISTGKGKTTCAWIHPSNQKVLFASTHLDPLIAKKIKEEINARNNPIKQKYSWSFDESFDLFEATTKGKILKRLTTQNGYDAEGSYSPNGEWIAFASNRRAYDEKSRVKMSQEERELFAKDPSSQMDIYLMRADGTQVKRLTDHLGYDGGPFFSSDGTKIVWRRFNKIGTMAEVFTMNLDGSEQTQVTHLGAMSWAPYFHPSGDYIIFTSNKIGYSNFELYIVDSKGIREPVRVSHLEGFDGLPVFSPDGQRLVWTRTNEKGESQLHEAQWDDTQARRALQLGPSRPDMRLLSKEIRIEDAKNWVNYLASTEMAGRMSGSPQESEYTRTLAQAFQDFGLQPFAGKDFLQTFEFSSGVDLGIENDAKLFIGPNKTALTLTKDWLPLSQSFVGITPRGSLAFVGYGIMAPAVKNQPAYNSYQDLDVKGKWVVAFRGLPEKVDNERRYHLNLYGRNLHKALVAKQQGAIGLILIDPHGAPATPMKMTFSGRSDQAGIPVIMLSAEKAEEIFKLQQTSVSEWTGKLAGGQTAGFSWSNVSTQVRVDLAFKKSQGRNAVALLKVPGATSTVLIGAHGDHLGHGEGGDSLARGEEVGKIHHGADDNASGVSVVMELANKLATDFKAGTFKPKQNIAFAIWSGEEIGILGSSFFAKSLGETPISAYINLDMVGRLRDELMIQGAGSAKEWRSLIEKLASTSEVSLSVQDDPYLPTDAMAFYLKEIPSISFFTGSHSEYHTPRDTADLIHFPGVIQIAKIVDQLTRNLAMSKTSLVKYQKVVGAAQTLAGGGRSFRLYLGTIPDYASEGKNGLLISGTSKNSPAEKAGLLPGDLIVELGGVKIANIYDYVYCLQAMKANEKTPVKIVRKNTPMELEIVPLLKAEQ